MTTRASYKSVKSLLCAVLASVAFSTTAAQAGNSWGPLEVIDMTTPVHIDGEIIITKGLVENFEFVAFDPPQRTYAFDAVQSDESAARSVAGWEGLVEVEMDEEETISVAYVPGHADRLKASDAETRMSGFYTMRYTFKSDSEFRPYAGAGVGVVAAEDSTRLAGGLAARAVAGFDITMDEQSGFFAEYSFMKSSSMMLAQADTSSSSLAMPDDEHSVKFGFRRTF